VAVVVDTHALVWYLNNDRSLSATATHAIARAEAAGEAVVSVASFIDLWYVSQTTGAVSPSEVDQIVRLVRKEGRASESPESPLRSRSSRTTSEERRYRTRGTG